MKKLTPSRKLLGRTIDELQRSLAKAFTNKSAKRPSKRSRKTKKGTR